MNLSFSLASEHKEQLLNADIDYAVDTFTAWLMRPDFTFSSSNHNNLINVSTNTGAINYTCAGSAKTITRASGSFITDGFVPNNYITTDGTNAGTYKVSSVTALVLKISLVGAATFVDESATSKTITSNDEHAASGGYTPTGVTVTFTISANTLQLDTFDLEASFGAAALAESPGIIVYDNTHATDQICFYARTAIWRVSV